MDCPSEANLLAWRGGEGMLLQLAYELRSRSAVGHAAPTDVCWKINDIAARFIMPTCCD